MLNQLLCGLSENSFWNDVFENKPTYLGRNKNLIDMFSVDQFDQYLIQNEGRLQDFVRVSLGGKTLDIPSHLGLSQPQREFVLSAFKDGATLKLEGLEFRHAALSVLCSNLEAEFGGHCFAKPFLTAPHHHGFSAHFDTTEVFVVQLEGRKEWRVWPKSVENPTLSMQRALSEDLLPPILFERELLPGDVMYIPAGSPHAAACADQHSLHMAIGIAPLRLYEFIENYIRVMSEEVTPLRTNIFPRTLPADIKLQVTDVLKKIADGIPNDVLHKVQVARNATKHETSNKRLRSLALVANLSLTSTLELRCNSKLTIQKTPTEIRIYYSSTLAADKPCMANPAHLLWPSACADALEFIENRVGGEFAPRDLPDNFHDSSKLMMCAELVKAGILTFV